jgi:short-subunit dehydrogenase
MTDAPTVLITGATDGLGRALAQRLAADGARLILHGRDAARLARVADDIGGARPDSP